MNPILSSKALMTKQQVKEIKPFEKELSHFTFSPHNIGYCSEEMKKVLAPIYSEITGAEKPCSGCDNSWLCKMNVWYQASKDKFENAEIENKRKKK